MLAVLDLHTCATRKTGKMSTERSFLVLGEKMYSCMFNCALIISRAFYVSNVMIQTLCRKEFRDVFRTLGSSSSMFYQCLLAERAQEVSGPGYKLMYGPICAHLWLFRSIISEVKSVRLHLAGEASR
jgi:hypothetical protein